MENKNKIGKPLKYDADRAGDYEKLEALIKEYFIKCLGIEGELEDGKFHKAPTMLGLALHLGFADKGELYEMLKRNNSISPLIKRAQSTIQNFCEQQLLVNPRQVSLIFAMKNWWGWQDKQDINTTVSGNIIVKFSDEDEQLPPDNTPENEENI